MTEAHYATFTFSRAERVDFAELDKKLRAEMSAEDRENYRILGEMSLVTRIVEATNRATGRRSRFEFAEHYNVGPGWQMWDLDDGRKIVSSFDLIDIEPVVSAETAPHKHVDGVRVTFNGG